ncbi:hypothetical protein AeRB84_014656 [Aphanomyces euteiches]|nr:hypothetical protein AeRB84_014656 [Aphanomyces euteiches]
MATRGHRTRSSLASDSPDLEPKRAPNVEGKPQSIRHKDKTNKPPLFEPQFYDTSSPFDTAPLPESPKASNTSSSPADSSNASLPKRVFLTRKTERRKSQSQSQPSQGSDSEVDFKEDVPGSFGNDIAGETKNQAVHIGQLHSQIDKQAAKLAEMPDRVVQYGQAIVHLSKAIEQLKLSACDVQGNRPTVD